MKITRTNRFKRAYKNLPERIQRRVDRALIQLVQNLRYPSLDANIIDHERRIWRARVTRFYRFTFQIEGDTYILRTVGGHDETLRNP